MLTAPFSMRALEREIASTELRNHPALKPAGAKDSVLKQATSICGHGFAGLSPKTVSLRGKDVYTIDQVQFDLVVRHLNRQIKRVSKTKQSDRNIIIKRIKSICEEGIPHNIYKLDIKNFYESIDSSELLEFISSNYSFDRRTVKILSMFMDRWSHLGGLPRGLSISATLSELAMKIFDDALKMRGDVYFYSRYVDDIIIITGGKENKESFLSEISKLLPFSLKFKDEKTKITSINDATQPAIPQFPFSFDFLGYVFRISVIKRKESRLYRAVSLDVAEKKVKRIKTKLVRSFIEFEKDGKFHDLVDRIFIISANYNYKDYSKNRRLNLGFYCTYRQIDFINSEAIKSLDKFLAAYILGYGGKQSKKVNLKLTKPQKEYLLKISFRANFEKRTFFQIKSKDLVRLKGCWQYV